ncbi:MAG: Gfo/Idh/MocA family protein [Planctomycetota bacterium]|jgi:predicted dehydrogenase
MKRRAFLKTTLGVGATVALRPSRVLGAGDEIRVGAIGMGSFVKIGGKGRGDVEDFRKLPGVRVTAIADCDADHLGHVAERFKNRKETVSAYSDFRDLLDDKNVDAVTIATPNHWHALMTIMACRAGKDVFVQKPASHNLFEGRKMVEAMRKHDRIVQATHGLRGGGAAVEAFEYVWQGNLGGIRCARGVNYKPRTSIGKVAGPQPIPKSCDYHLWCGPAPKKPLLREYLHYDWHWDWDTGNGDLGNMGIHFMDACRWALRKNKLPRRVMSIGGRLGYDDDGQTPNTLITLLDYEPAPIIFEVRGLPKNASLRESDWSKNANQNMDRHRDVRVGTVVECEGGYVQGDAAYDYDGRRIKQFTRARPSTKQNFIDAVRSRDPKTLFSDALEGHLSCGLVHLANVSLRLGRRTTNDAIREIVAGEHELSESFGRLDEHLKANRIESAEGPLMLGPMLTMDPATERFTGAFSEEASALLSREYRRPFVVG